MKTQQNYSNYVDKEIVGGSHGVWIMEVPLHCQIIILHLHNALHWLQNKQSPNSIIHLTTQQSYSDYVDKEIMVVFSLGFTNCL